MLSGSLATLFGSQIRSGSLSAIGWVDTGCNGFSVYRGKDRKSLQEFSTAALQSSYALGVSKAYTLFKLVLPQCKEDIVAAITLAGGFAMGATAPIILTGAVIFAPIPSSLSSPVMALPFHLYILTGEGISLEKAYATALVLITLIFAINIISIALTSRRKEVGS